MEKLVILTMVFLFVAFRLWSVLGRRTGHEQQPIAKPIEAQAVPPPALRFFVPDRFVTRRRRPRGARR